MSVHFAPPYPVETASRVLHDNSLYPDRQPRRDPTWIGIVAFTFLAGVLLAWHAPASDTPLDSATMAALEQGQNVDAYRGNGRATVRHLHFRCETFQGGAESI